MTSLSVPPGPATYGRTIATEIACELKVRLKVQSESSSRKLEACASLFQLSLERSPRLRLGRAPWLGCYIAASSGGRATNAAVADITSSPGDSPTLAGEPLINLYNLRDLKAIERCATK